ncbi:hypothetical protein H4R34_000143 [Dimargaris verticillata]|uniref:Ubiquitin-like domain-containing protein n=1 Tax=Dimargaris verticillata TaxID=2761393 RepID=A0A9W8EG60_9FUNG|nr:hypothetical protein H4R34_000143 [Dimargaris verticillata]
MSAPDAVTEPPAQAAATPAAPKLACNTVHLTCLLVSGKRHTFTFAPTLSIGQAKQQVFDQWPKEWEGERPASAHLLRLVYLGRFLDDASTLADNKLLPGKPTIVHLVIKVIPGTDSSDDPKAHDKVPQCQCIIF